LHILVVVRHHPLSWSLCHHPSSIIIAVIHHCCHITLSSICLHHRPVAVVMSCCHCCVTSSSPEVAEGKGGVCQGGQYFTTPHTIHMDSSGLQWTSLDFTIYWTIFTKLDSTGLSNLSITKLDSTGLSIQNWTLLDSTGLPTIY